MMIAALFAVLVALSGPPAMPIDTIHRASGEGFILVAPKDTVAFQFDAAENYGVFRGSARFTSASGFGFSMDVDCLSVVGHTAWVSGILTSATYPLVPGQSAVFEVVDGGVLDQISRPITGLPSPCTDESARALYQVQGNIRVR